MMYEISDEELACLREAFLCAQVATWAWTDERPVNGCFLNLIRALDAVAPSTLYGETLRRVRERRAAGEA